MELLKSADEYLGEIEGVLRGLQGAVNGVRQALGIRPRPALVELPPVAERFEEQLRDYHVCEDDMAYADGAVAPLPPAVTAAAAPPVPPVALPPQGTVLTFESLVAHLALSPQLHRLFVSKGSRPMTDRTNIVLRYFGHLLFGCETYRDMTLFLKMVRSEGEKLFDPALFEPWRLDFGRRMTLAETVFGKCAFKSALNEHARIPLFEIEMVCFAGLEEAKILERREEICARMLFLLQSNVEFRDAVGFNGGSHDAAKTKARFRIWAEELEKILAGAALVALPAELKSADPPQTSASVWIVRPGMTKAAPAEPATASEALAILTAYPVESRMCEVCTHPISGAELPVAYIEVRVDAKKWLIEHGTCHQKEAA